MKFKLTNLHLETRKAGIDVPLSDFNYFWGPISAGKSTIARLILFCLGRSIKETPALKNEFVSAKLSFEVGNYTVISERKKNSSSLVVTFKKLKSKEYDSVIISAKASSGESIIPHKDIVNMSDLIFYLAGIEPPKVRRSKIKENTKLQRLSFRDLLWYCYLEQEDIDSSLFYLESEDYNRRLKSYDVLRYVLGYYDEKISQLERSLVLTKQEQLATRQSAEQIKTILNENNIQDTNKILNEKKNLNKRLKEIQMELNDVRSSIKNSENQHVIDELKEKRRYLSNSVNDISLSIDDLDQQLNRQQKLQNEFLTSKFKNNRINSAKTIFEKVAFEACPKCGRNIPKVNKKDSCILCKQTGELPEKTFDIDTELNERIQELKLSIEKLNSQKTILTSRLKERQTLASKLDKEISELEFNFDSSFISKSSHLFDERGIVKGQIEYLDSLLPLPKRVEELENESCNLLSKIEKIKEELSQAKKIAEKNQETVKLLKSLFLDNLQRSNFPKITNEYEVIFNTKDFIPKLKPKSEGDLGIIEFVNAGSGGKKTLFKTCFALALQRLSVHTHHVLPNILIIDSPMKNIGTTEDRMIFEGFHKLIYELASEELKDVQFIIIGSDYLPPNKKLGVTVNERKMERESNSKYPPLIPYYEGQ